MIMDWFMGCFYIQLLDIRYLTHLYICNQLINSSDNIHIRPSCLIHTRNTTKHPNSAAYIIMHINDKANYLLVHCSESNEEHRQHIFPRRAPIMSTSPIELNDDGAADPATDSAGRGAYLAHVRNSCNGLNKKNG